MLHRFSFYLLLNKIFMLMLSIIKKVHEQDQQKIEKHNNLQIKFERFAMK